MISTRTLALTRYKRNHELMEEVFKKAAFGNYPNHQTHPCTSLMTWTGILVTPPPPAPAYSIFDKLELESKVVSGFEQQRTIPA